MTEFICEQCGSITSNNETPVRKGVTNVIKTIVYLIGFVILLCIPIIGWILAIILLLKPINGKDKKICPQCKNENCLIPIETPKGKELYKKYHGPEE